VTKQPLAARARSTEPIVTIGERATGMDAPRYAFAETVLGGEQPFVEQLTIPAAVEPPDLVPPEFVVTAVVRGSGSELLARRDGATLHIHRFLGTTGVRVSADSLECLDSVVTQVRETVKSLVGEVRDEELDVSIWSYGSGGSRSISRRLIAPSWSEIACNYPSAVRHRLERLVKSEAPAGTARLVLWHGPPGTGKTTAVLALLEAWREWCSGHVIADPERMFLEANYLHDVLTATPSSFIEPRLREQDHWNLVIAEDADDYLRSDARARSGPALGRLLNVSDGIIGRGNRTIILLTTNDELGRLHPAVVRPGRCLAIVEFARFERKEAQDWLGDAGTAPAHGATLAELFQLRDGDTELGVQAECPAPGAYL